MTNVTKRLGRIARLHLGIPTLNPRDSDRLDFHEVAVWAVEAALMAAYEAGLPAKTSSSEALLALLARRREIAVVWSIDDVLQVRPDLSPRQAWKVLQSIKRFHDAKIGIDWDVLACHAEMLYGFAEFEGDDHD